MASDQEGAYKHMMQTLLNGKALKEPQVMTRYNQDHVKLLDTTIDDVVKLYPEVGFDNLAAIIDEVAVRLVATGITVMLSQRAEIFDAVWDKLNLTPTEEPNEPGTELVATN